MHINTRHEARELSVFPDRFQLLFVFLFSHYATILSFWNGILFCGSIYFNSCLLLQRVSMNKNAFCLKKHWTSKQY